MLITLLNRQRIIHKEFNLTSQAVNKEYNVEILSRLVHRVSLVQMKKFFLAKQGIQKLNNPHILLIYTHHTLSCSPKPNLRRSLKEMPQRDCWHYVQMSSKIFRKMIWPNTKLCGISRRLFLKILTDIFDWNVIFSKVNAVLEPNYLTLYNMGSWKSQYCLRFFCVCWVYYP